MTDDARQNTGPKFKMGQLVATPGALAAIREAGQTVHALISRHAVGDWGCLDAEDKALNDAALKDGSRLFSAYVLRTGQKVWVITEAVGDGQRASTCVLLPDEY